MIEPFRGWWYATSPRVAPVRDALSEDARLRLYDDPYQALHIAFPNTLEGLAARWTAWLREQVLWQEPVPALYAYGQTFHMPGGARGPLTRWGLIGLLPLGTTIYPHEKTLSDRQSAILRAFETLPVQATPVHLLAEGNWESMQVIIRSYLLCPRFSVAAQDGVMHRLSPIQHQAHIQALQSGLAEAKYYIADGHHRWKSAQEAGFSYLLVFVTNREDPSLWIPSAYRLLESDAPILAQAERYFELRLSGARVPLWREVGGLRHAVGLVDSEGVPWLLRLRPTYWSLLEKASLISYVHDWLIQPALEAGGGIEFSRDWAASLAKVRTQKAWLFVNPPLALSDVLRAAETQTPLPPKATYFFPKVLSGLVFYEERT